MVPINEAISNGAWLHCEQGKNLFETNQFRLKINSFRKLNFSEVDNPENISGIDSNSVIWLLEIEVVNLNKIPLQVHQATQKLVLVDGDGFTFPIFEDGHLHLHSEYSKKAKLNRFWSDDLLPKIKAVGSITFQLPDDDEATYSIGLKDNGTVQEV